MIIISSQVICYFSLEACNFFSASCNVQCLFPHEFYLSLGEPLESAEKLFFISVLLPFLSFSSFSLS